MKRSDLSEADGGPPRSPPRHGNGHLLASGGDGNDDGPLHRVPLLRRQPLPQVSVEFGLLGLGLGIGLGFGIGLSNIGKGIGSGIGEAGKQLGSGIGEAGKQLGSGIGEAGKQLGSDLGKITFREGRTQGLAGAYSVMGRDSALTISLVWAAASIIMKVIEVAAAGGKSPPRPPPSS
ncbi:hypothetical protein Vretimale_4961 [Volvox reticuliferus]|nr:hypothetical protein Vretimale_4961 [Volvox reticuliferus]